MQISVFYSCIGYFIEKKTIKFKDWSVGQKQYMVPYGGARVDYTLPYVDSRVDSNPCTIGNPMPKSTWTFYQSRLYPPQSGTKNLASADLLLVTMFLSNLSSSSSTLTEPFLAAMWAVVFPS